MKLLIAIPAMDYVHVGFLRSLHGLTEQLHRDNVAFELAVETGTLVYYARDRLARKAVNEGFSHVLWLDSDMVFPPQLFEDLRFCGEPFVTGAAVSRRPPFASCVFASLDPIKRVKELPKEPFEVVGCGFACVLISTAILRDVLQEKGTCFFPTTKAGEDVAFCVRARELGHKIICDPSVKVGHIAHYPIYPDDAERWRAK